LAMSSVTRAGTGMASASRAAAGRPGKEGRWGPVLRSGQGRPASRRSPLWAGPLAAGGGAAGGGGAPAPRAVLGGAPRPRAPRATLGGSRLAWLSVAVAAQIMSLAGSTAAQHLLLAADGARVPWRALVGPVLARPRAWPGGCRPGRSRGRVAGGGRPPPRRGHPRRALGRALCPR